MALRSTAVRANMQEDMKDSEKLSDDEVLGREFTS